MSPLSTSFLWLLLAFGVGTASVLGVGLGYGYGRLARNWSDERAVRGANVVAIGPSAVVGIAVWIVVDAGATVGDLLRGDGVGTVVLAAVAGGVAAGCVAAGTVAGIARRYDLPGMDDPSCARNHYFRYVSGLFMVTLLFASLLEPAIEAGALAVAGVLLLFFAGFWAGSPFLRELTIGTRPPTGPEQDRLEGILEAVSLEPRRVRVVEAGDRYAGVELLGAPGGRTLFVGEGALSGLEDEALTGVVAARREQAAHCERFVSAIVLVCAAVPLLAGLTGELQLPAGIGATAVLGFVGFAVSRRLRLRADARAAERVGPGTLADAFERAADESGFDLETSPKRTWFGTTPPLAVRIERLRAAVASGDD
ncbi:peptidase [Halobiforma lacisalsi AJ5]|uniref:Peptidase n=1 Tax=Natronobacterium lacisalsi AJ5 TaxID=358396 RepID=M0L3U6_NATLA|nr:M48 family metalloprotease [Halobiforma lacisalsi]APW98231.1 peptidase [Halobiforma lacisalsi AJ5]EMA28216.1 peptidase [Halobiforma lacisalsi AJ5]